MKPNERSCRNVRGVLINSPISGAPCFRVYNEARTEFKDYEIRHQDLSITITDDYSSFFDGETAEGFAGYIDYPSRLFSRHKNAPRQETGPAPEGQSPAGQVP